MALFGAGCGSDEPSSQGNAACTLNASMVCGCPGGGQGTTTCVPTADQTSTMWGPCTNCSGQGGAGTTGGNVVCQAGQSMPCACPGGSVSGTMYCTLAGDGVSTMWGTCTNCPTGGTAGFGGGSGTDGGGTAGVSGTAGTSGGTAGTGTGTSGTGGGGDECGPNYTCGMTPLGQSACGTAGPFGHMPPMCSDQADCDTQLPGSFCADTGGFGKFCIKPCTM